MSVGIENKIIQSLTMNRIRMIDDFVFLDGTGEGINAVEGHHHPLVLAHLQSIHPSTTLPVTITTPSPIGVSKRLSVYRASNNHTKSIGNCEVNQFDTHLLNHEAV